MANTKAILITIGDELLIGQTIDTNSAWMAQKLNELGVDVIKRIAIGDDKDAIVQALDEEIPQAEIILITGGLGPTSDDITKPVLCEYFGGELVVNEDVLKQINSIFEKRKIPILDVILKQAEVPNNCTVLLNDRGSAPGMLFERDGKYIISMPGVPHEMKGIMEQEVLPKIRQNFSSDALLHATIITAGKGESFIAEKIKDLEAALPSHIKLAYLPGHWMVKLRLTGRGNNPEQLAKELQLRQEEIANRIEDIVIALQDEELEFIIGKQLVALGKTIGLAESCTGGYIAHKFTQIMGASKFFQGCVVSYQTEIKERVLGVSDTVIQEQTSVCEGVAIQMAKGAKDVLRSDIGFGITGLLSEGGKDDRVAVGTVWMCVCDNEKVHTKEFHFPYDRLRNKEVAVNMALLLIWKFINNKI